MGRFWKVWPHHLFFGVLAATSGIAVLLISTELDEIIALSDRVLVMSEGRITAEFDGGSDDRAAIGLAMAGATTQIGEARV